MPDAVSAQAPLPQWSRSGSNSGSGCTYPRINSQMVQTSSSVMHTVIVRARSWVNSTPFSVTLVSLSIISKASSFARLHPFLLSISSHSISSFSSRATSGLEPNPSVAAFINSSKMDSKTLWIPAWLSSRWWLALFGVKRLKNATGVKPCTTATFKVLVSAHTHSIGIFKFKSFDI